MRADLRQILADWWLLNGNLLTLLLILVAVVVFVVVPATLALLAGGVAITVGSVAADDDEGDRPADDMVVGAAPVLLPAGVGRLNGLAKVLHEQAGHWRGSSLLSAATLLDGDVLLKDWRSQCLREKTGMSKKAQYRWSLILALNVGPGVNLLWFDVVLWVQWSP